jgi:hypothetical protein
MNSKDKLKLQIETRYKFGLFYNLGSMKQESFYNTHTFFVSIVPIKTLSIVTIKCYIVYIRCDITI